MTEDSSDPNKPPEDDSDLEDLLSPKEDQSLKDAMDKLANVENSIHISKHVSLIEFIFACISVFVMKRPKLSSCIVVSFLLGLFLVVNLTLSNASREVVIENDYSSIQSKYDLKIGSIDHWCLMGGNQKCRCEDPLQPVSRLTGGRSSAWERAHTMNKELVERSIEEWGEDEIDVVFIGENNVELWAGRSVSYNSTTTREIGNKFSSKFNKDKKGKYNGIPLGIAGDTAPNVLWRIQNGEIPGNLNPKFWWLVLGTNDLSMRSCSAEVVLLGILRVIEEIQEMRPDAKIIVNSILPMTSDRSGKLSLRKGKKPKSRLENHRSLAKEKNTKEKEVKDKKAVEKELEGKTASPMRSRFSIFQSQFSLWPSAVVINNALKKFCAKHKRIVFFDSYDIFVDTVSDVPTIDKELMKLTTLGLPTTLGHSDWLDQVHRRMKYMMKKYDLKPDKKKKESDPLGDDESD